MVAGFGRKAGVHVACSGVRGGEPVTAVPTCRLGSAGGAHLAARPPRATLPALDSGAPGRPTAAYGSKAESPPRSQLHCVAGWCPVEGPGQRLPRALHTAPGSEETGS